MAFGLQILVTLFHWIEITLKDKQTIKRKINRKAIYIAQLAEKIILNVPCAMPK